ncbi:hypothetical protein G7072_18590 [Nocardioides sp. HDW12B]|uniref:hypothetical protein n=1 Tax=Nocardioides sp. HDW12B TaxID=2714939 RepID=UPI00140C64FA|nr:hypothetical protein [Nocardioides sp. HDW12B]QIK68082.1 hypothetical protein G7072_18590 [Nocardioides sp. HDW12B]
MRRLALALDGLERAVATPPRLQQSWRFLVRKRLAWVEQALAADHDAERATEAEPWLEPRAAQLHREQVRLQSRTSVLAATVCEAADLRAVRESLGRLVVDLQHHLQRVNDLTYDAVDLDVGGSD